MKVFAVIFALHIGILPAFADEPLLGVKLMVDQHGEIYPKGATLGLSDIAELASSNKLAEAKIEIVKEVQKETSREV